MQRLESRAGPEGYRVYSDPIRRSIRFMQNKLCSKLTLDDLANVACMSPYHYVHVFRGVTGVPPARFLGALRLEAAKEMLLTTDRAVLDICQDVSYCSLGTFTSRFRQLVGVSPAQYRELFRMLANGECLDIPRPNIEGVPLHGMVEHDLQGDVVVFVGLFSSPIPQNLPLSCDTLIDTQQFRLKIPEQGGPYFVLAVALHRSGDLAALFDNRRLIAGLAASAPITARAAEQPLQLRLRSQDILDPPILVAFPLLVFLQMNAWSRPVPEMRTAEA